MALFRCFRTFVITLLKLSEILFARNKSASSLSVFPSRPSSLSRPSRLSRPSFPSFPSRTIFAAAQRLPLDPPELFWTCLPSTGSH
jgi:hypothetical protein